jgi:exonuclease SbcD
MRLLHTADWHLGDRLGRIDRTADIRRGVERIAEYCRDEKVDVLVVAGDIFSEAARPDGLRDAVEHLRKTFGPFLRDGGTILAVTGNHDNETFCETLLHAMNLAAPLDDLPSAVASPGRLYLAAEPTLLRLRDRNHQVAQFVLMPYPTPAVFLAEEQNRRYANLAEKNDRLRSAFQDRLRSLLADASYDRTVPSILIAHVAVCGADLANRFRISEETDIVIDEPTWATTFSYVALGHIHKPQAIGGHANVRYCGSIERLDLGESADSKSVVVLDIDHSGRCTDPRVCPLPATSIHRIELHDLQSEIPMLSQRYPDHESALVNLRFEYESGRDDLFEIQRQLEAIFPRWYDRDWQCRGDLGPALVLGEAAAKSFEASVADYLRDQLMNHSEVERAALFALAESYLPGLGSPWAKIDEADVRP